MSLWQALHHLFAFSLGGWGFSPNMKASEDERLQPLKEV
jgi:hypothetical protein